jgi:hypothetical protein
MRKLRTLVVISVLVVLHAPSQAQALLFRDLFPADFFAIGTNEPALLLLTGLALIALGRIGAPRRGRPARRPVADATTADGTAAVKSAPAERAA